MYAHTYFYRTKRFRLKTASKLLHLIERCDWYLRQNCKIKPPLFFDSEFKKIAHTNFWSFFVTQNCNFSFNTFSSLSAKEKDVTSPKKYAGNVIKEKNEIHTVHPLLKNDSETKVAMKLHTIWGEESENYFGFKFLTSFCNQ